MLPDCIRYRSYVPNGSSMHDCRYTYSKAGKSKTRDACRAVHASPLRTALMSQRMNCTGSFLLPHSIANIFFDNLQLGCAIVCFVVVHGM